MQVILKLKRHGNNLGLGNKPTWVRLGKDHGLGKEVCLLRNLSDVRKLSALRASTDVETGPC